MLVAAASPEGVRGSALARAGRRHAPAPVRIGGAAGALGRLSRRRHAGVPVRRQPWRAGFLFHRDEHAHPGRASHHRGRDWRGPGARDAAHRRWRAAALAPAGYLAAGAAIECRLNAEDPQRNFAPSPGRVDQLRWPGGPGVRVDSMLYPGCTVSPYDSLLAKLIVWDEDRGAALAGWRGRWTRSSWKASIPRWRCTARWRRIPRWWRATTTRTGWKPGCGRSGRSSDERALHPWRRRIHLRRDQRGHVAGILLQGHGHHPRCASARSTA